MSCPERPNHLRAHLLRGLWFAALVLANPLPAAAADGTVTHRLSFPHRQNQYVHVVAEWPVSADYLDLAMPSWTPGSYLIRDFAGNVEGLQARDGQGRARAVEKTAKNHWRIETGGAARLTVEYDVWAGELNVATSWVEAGGALINGAGTFLYSEQSRDRPQRVEIELPGDWAAVYTPLKPVGAADSYIASSFDELVDSPIVAGNLQRLEFRVKGQHYALILPTDNPLWDAERSRNDVEKIVAAQQAFWEVNPFDREYLFFNFFMGPFGGLEHDQSTVMMCSPWQMSGQVDYIKWLGLVSHEFFHAWNVRRLRPAELSRYDYDKEMYTRELWLAEGLSSYYDDLLVFRSGLIDVGDYLKLLAQEIRNYEIMPGRHVRSAERASFDTWIKQYQPDENSVNSTVSYYRKGALIGFVTDADIRRQTHNRSSLDTVMRAMYRKYGPGGTQPGGYPPGAFEQEVEAVAGPDAREFVAHLLRTTDDPDVDAALAWYGLELNRDPDAVAAEKAGVPGLGGFGVIWEESTTGLQAEQVILGYAAAAAGMLPGDELLAIDGYRVTPQTFPARVQRLQIGQSVDLTVVRHERLMTLHAVVQREFPENYQIVTANRLSQAEKKRLEAWLGRELRFLQ